MKVCKSILICCALLTIFATAKCYAVTNIDESFSQDKTIYIKTFEVAEEEKSTFESMLEKEIVVDESKYNLKDYSFSGGNTETIIDINTTKKITTKTNNIDAIIEQLGETLEYKEDGYTGVYNLDPNSIKIRTNYNGFYDKLIEETVEYKDLSKNDLDYIPKEINKNGYKLVLLKTDWIPQNYINIGENKVPDKYTASCYYATKQRINNPVTYTVEAEYFGTAKKINENPTIYKVVYEKEIVEVPVEEKGNNLLPIVGGTTGIILIVVFFITGNVTVYNYKEGQWVKVGKTRMYKNKINLTKFSLFEKTNKYKLELSKGLTRKKQGQLITVAKDRNSVKLLVNADNNSSFKFEVRL